MSRIVEFLLRLKPGELAGADSLLPSAAAGYDNWIILGLAVAFIGLVALTVMSYLREGDAPRRVKLTIAAIRILVIALIFAMLFQPGVILRYRKNVYSNLVVLFDDSLSMSLKDRYADPEVRRVVAERCGVPPAEVDQLSRTRIAREVLARRDGPLDRLGRDHKLVLMKFAATEGSYTQRLAELPAGGDAEQHSLAVMRVQRELMQKLTAGGFETNLARALRQSADRVRGRRVSAIVVVSDGQVTGADGGGADVLRAALAEVRKRRVPIPVFAVAVGDPEPRRNVKVTRLQGPAKARKGADIELTAYLANNNCGGQHVDLRLFRRQAGKRPWQYAGVTKKVKLAGDPHSRRGEEQKVALRHQATELGKFQYKVEVKPVEREADLEDNAATAAVEVSEERVKILLVSGDGGWEFQYLRNLLLRSPERYAVSVWQQNAEKEFNQEASSGMRLNRLPRDRKKLFDYEVVILYDPAYTKGGFDGEFVEMLEDFVANHHGGLCYIAANKYSELNLTAPGPFEPLAAMLPAVLDRQTINIAERIARSQPMAWPVLPTAVGLDHPVLRLAGSEEENVGVWRSLPGVYWSHPVVKLKPLASVLAVSADPARRTTDASGVPSPLVAVQYYGKGRCLYLGSDETWRWRYCDDGRYHRRFWFNAVDFLAAGRLQKHRVIITAGGDKFTVGEKMRVRAEAYDRDYRPLEDQTFVVEMISPDRTARKIELQRDPKKKARDRYEAEVTLRTVGTFELTAKSDDPTYKGLVAGKTVTVTLPEEELRHPEADPTTLQTMAPGERFMMIHQADRLAELVPPGKRPVFNDVPRDLWDVPLTIVVIVGLLAAEWILRKKYNMA